MIFISCFLSFYLEFLPYLLILILLLELRWRGLPPYLKMMGSFISENMVVISRAVTIYLEMSINHLPNSFMSLLQFRCKDRNY